VGAGPQLCECSGTSNPNSWGFKKKIKDLKNRTKTKANAFKREARKTGRGENEAPPLTATEEKLLSFVGIDSVEGISGGIDTFRESGKYNIHMQININNKFASVQ
jgi:hypothetical protein